VFRNVLKKRKKNNERKSANDVARERCCSAFIPDDTSKGRQYVFNIVRETAAIFLDKM